MSEFKYACPVCGQHIKCDSSQAGTQMQCPTCFQKIIVPQAPTQEQKLILTGTKVGGRPVPKKHDAGGSVHMPSKGVSGAMAVIIILLFIGVAVAFVYHGTIFKSKTTTSNLDSPAVTESSIDTNWTLNLMGWKIPDSTAAGRVAGQNFICDHAYLSNGYLTLRDGDLAVSINFSGITANSLAGKSLNVTTNAPAAARVSLRWKEGDQTMHESFTNDYAMLLNFGNIDSNQVNAGIYLCTSDDKMSYVAGTFRAEIRKSKLRSQ